MRQQKRPQPDRHETFRAVGISDAIIKEASKKIIQLDRDIKDRGLIDDISITANFYKSDIDVDDVLLPRLDVYEQSVYRRLYRLSWGFNKNWCRVGYGALMGSCNITKNKISEVLKKLESDGWISNEGFDRSKGTNYRIYLPSEKGVESKTKTGKVSSKGVIQYGIPQQCIPQGITPDMIQQGIPQRITPSEPLKTNDSEGVIQYGIPQQGTIIDRSYYIDLSLDHLITLFYNSIGQERISKKKRESALATAKELQEGGFKAEDIEYAIKWTIKNAKEKPYDFAILNHTIGQAMADKKKEQKRVEIKQEIVAERESLEQEADAMRERKGYMPENERRQLREQALNEIKADRNIKADFITEPLIESKENEILKRD